MAPTQTIYMSVYSGYPQVDQVDAASVGRVCTPDIGTFISMYISEQDAVAGIRDMGFFQLLFCGALCFQ